MEQTNYYWFEDPNDPVLLRAWEKLFELEQKQYNYDPKKSGWQYMGSHLTQKGRYDHCFKIRSHPVFHEYVSRRVPAESGWNPQGEPSELMQTRNHADTLKRAISILHKSPKPQAAKAIIEQLEALFLDCQSDITKLEVLEANENRSSTGQTTLELRDLLG